MFNGRLKWSNLGGTEEAIPIWSLNISVANGCRC